MDFKNLTSDEASYLRDALSTYRTRAGGETVKSSALAAKHIEYLKNWRQEVVVAIFLTTSNKVIATEELFRGGIKATVVDVSVLLKRCIELEATGLILAHNHPSGNTKPSVADLSITRSIRDAGKMIGCKLLDHIIIGGGAGPLRYESLAEEGYVDLS